MWRAIRRDRYFGARVGDREVEFEAGTRIWRAEQRWLAAGETDTQPRAICGQRRIRLSQFIPIRVLACPHHPELAEPRL